MKKSIYQEVLRTLKNEQIYERKDKHLLFDCLPYSLKNEMIMEMYKKIIQNFIFFKEIDNSDFIIKVATSLKPLIAIKGDILIQEGDFVKEIFFVKAGVIGLNICINLDHLENSIKKFFGKNEIGRFDVTYLKSGFMNNRNTTKITDIKTLDTFLNNKSEDLDSNSESENNCENIEDIRILEIRKNEHFGDALMFLNERSPLIAKVRTRSTELLILRKMEAIEIYSVYPNIWKRINKKSLYNMEQIYLKIKRIIIEISKRYNIKIYKSFICKKREKKLLKGFKKKKVHFFSDVKKVTKENKENKENKVIKEKEDQKAESQKDISEKDENKLNEKLNNQNNIVENKNKENEQKQIICQVMTFEEEKIKGEKDSDEEKNKSKNESSKKKIKLREKENDDKENKNILESKSNEHSNNKLTNSIIKTNSFKIICEKETLKDKDKKNKNKKDKFNISIQRHSFLISGRVWTLRKDSEESLKVNKSFKVDDSFNSISNNLEEDSSYFVRVKDKKSLNLSLSKNEKLGYSSFINLCFIKENSLLFSSSYENINIISKNMYIKDFNLQKKVKSIIINELNNKESDKSLKKKSTKYEYRHSTTHTPDFQLNSYKTNTKPKISDTVIYKPLNHCGSLKRFGTKFSKNNKNEMSINSESSLPTVKNENRPSIFAFRNTYKFKGGGDTQNKIKRKISKKKLVKVKKKLSVITKNIQNTNKAINNPNEFYMNFFNDIIQKETFDIKIDDDKDEKKKKNLSDNTLYSQK